MKLIKTIINRGRDFGIMPNSDLFVLLDQPYFVRPATREERRKEARKRK